MILAELASVLSHDRFSRSPTLSNLLSFLITQELAGAGDSLKESYIGHAHFGRSADYNPKTDALVRVSMRRLRALLAACYEEAVSRPVRIELQVGSYVPSFVVNKVTEKRIGHLHGASGPPFSGGQLVFGESPSLDPATARDAHSVSQQASERPSNSRSHFVTSFGVSFAAVVLLLVVILWRNVRSVDRHSDTWTAHTMARLGGVATFPDFSPDGQRLVFVWAKSPESGESGLYVRGVSAEGITKLATQSGENTRPAWSPSGSRMAYIRLADGKKEIRLLSFSDGTDRRVALLHGAFPWLCQTPKLSWSHDENQIITADSKDASSACRIVSVNVDSGEEKVLNSGTRDAIADVEPTVSPDGTQIAFLRNTGTMVGNLYVMQLDGEKPRRITQDRQDILGFCWSASGNGFILASNREDGILRLWETRGDGAKFTRLTDGLTTVGFPSVSPDGRTILFASYRNTANIWPVNQRLAAVKRLAYEAADSGLLSAELAAGIRRVKGANSLEPAWATG